MRKYSERLQTLRLPPRGPRGHTNNKLRDLCLRFSLQGMTAGEALQKAEEIAGAKAVDFVLNEEGRVKEVPLGAEGNEAPLGVSEGEVPG